MYVQTRKNPVAGAWLRGILGSLGFDLSVVRAYGTHSCKATCLSWTGKCGIDLHHQRTLGHHTAAGDQMVNLYSRDAVPRDCTWPDP